MTKKDNSLSVFGHLEVVTWHGHGLDELRQLSAMLCWCLCSITCPCDPADPGQHFGNESQTGGTVNCFPVLGTRTFHLCTFTSGSSSDDLWGKAYPQEFSQSSEHTDHITGISVSEPQSGKQLISCAFYPYPSSVLHRAGEEGKLKGYEV